jgi:DUF1009 family protein
MSEEFKLELSNLATVSQLEEKVKEVVNDVKIDFEHKLSEEQTKVLKIVYDKIKESTDLLLHHPKLENALKLTQMIASIIKLLESIKINDILLSGKDKKQIALELGKKLIEDLIKEGEKKIILLMMYDSAAEQLLETMVDVSHHLNVKVKEIASSCCDGLLSLLKKN